MSRTTNAIRLEEFLDNRRGVDITTGRRQLIIWEIRNAQVYRKYGPRDAIVRSLATAMDDAGCCVHDLEFDWMVASDFRRRPNQICGACAGLGHASEMYHRLAMMTRTLDEIRKLLVTVVKQNR